VKKDVKEIMNDNKINNMVLTLMERIGFISKNQKIKHLLNLMADDIKKKREGESASPVRSVCGKNRPERQTSKVGVEISPKRRKAVEVTCVPDTMSKISLFDQAKTTDMTQIGSRPVTTALH
jgi:hypothetical protein